MGIGDLLGSNDGQVCLLRPYASGIDDESRFLFEEQLQHLWSVSEGEFHIILFESGRLMVNTYKRRPGFDVDDFEQQLDINGQSFLSAECADVRDVYLYMYNGRRGKLINLLVQKKGSR